MENPKRAAILGKQGFEKSLVDEIINTGRFKKVRQDASVISPGMDVKEVPLVLEGTLKVMRQDKEGNDFFLSTLRVGKPVPCL